MGAASRACQPAHVSPRAISAFLYLLIFGSLAGFVAFNWLLGHVPTAKVGTYAYVNPIIAIFTGWLVGNEALHVWLFLGIAIILAGVYLVREDHAPSKEIELEPD
jgi:drug/metabolite transporter (DMT)-like permease